MKIFIFEPYSSGHRLHFVRVIAQAFLDLGLQPQLATSESTLASPQAEIHLGGVIDEIAIHHLPDDKPTGRWGSLSQQSSWLKSVLEQSVQGKVLIPTASQFIDVFLKWHLTGVRWRDAVSVEALFLGPGFGYRVGSLRRRFIKRFHLQAARSLPFDRYYHLDAHQLEIVKQGVKQQSQRFVVMPDPAPKPMSCSKVEARQRLGIPSTGQYALMAGGITEQKGAIKLLRASRAGINDKCSQTRLLLAGRADQMVRDWIRQHAGEAFLSRVVHLDRHLSEQEFDDAFAASDLVLALQSNRPGSSGTVVRAIASGLPVLVGSGGWAERTVTQFQLGSTIRDLEPKPLADAIRSALQEFANYVPTESSNRFADFATEANFAAHWTQMTRQKLGMDQRQMISWPDVMFETDQ